MTSSPNIGLFSTDPGKIVDFSGKKPADIFNQSILPRINSFLDLLGNDPGGLEEADQRRQQELSRRTEESLFAQQQDDEFLSGVRERRAAMPEQDAEDYSAPLPARPETARPASKALLADPTSGGFSKESIKLANYGYDSDTTKDHNSNVLRIGHANNKLVDGYSAALTKSLAQRYGLKTGDEFEVVTADGKVMTRRYDDTVPTKYKGKALPETVDLYERTKGSNNFGGKVIGIRPLKKSRNSSAPSPELPPWSERVTDYDNPILPTRT